MNEQTFEHPYPYPKQATALSSPALNGGASRAGSVKSQQLLICQPSNKLAPQTWITSIFVRQRL
jgi:hypothetical protein